MSYIDKVTVGGNEYEIHDARGDVAFQDGYYQSMTVGDAEQLVSTVGVEDKVPYNFRTSGGSADIGDREVDKIVGGTVAWNQLVQNGNFANTDVWTGPKTTMTVSDNVATITPISGKTDCYKGQNISMIIGHKYLCIADCKAVENSDNVMILQVYYGSASDNWTKTTTDSNWHTFATIFSCVNNTYNTIRLYANEQEKLKQFKNVVIFDITQMFGSTIADYIYTLETSTPGSGVAWFKSLFHAPYYAYNAGELISVKPTAHQMTGLNAFDLTTGKAKVVGGHEYEVVGTYTSLSLNGETVIPVSNKFTPAGSGELTVTGGDGTTCIHLVWNGERDGEYEPYDLHSYPLDDVELRGIPKLDANNALYYDGDTYEADGTVTRHYDSVNLGTLTWNYNSTRGFFYATIDDKKTGSANCISKDYANIGNAYDSAMENASDMSMGYGYSDTIIKLKNTAYTDASAFRTAMNGFYVVYELATPTTETADPYQNPQYVNDWGTEEYVDTRTVAIPVGHETTYRPNLRAKLEMAPNSPSGDGDYIVRQTSGQNVYVPITFPADELPAAPAENGTYKLTCTVADGETTFSWAEEE